MKIPAIILDKKWTRILGAYLLCIVSFQIYIYVKLQSGIDIIFYFDPRIGLSALLEGPLRIPKLYVLLVEWISAVWIGGIAALMLLGKNTIIRTYIVSEILLFLPNLMFAVLVVYFNVRPVTGFSIRELFCPLLVMLYTTIVPFFLIFMRATIMWRK